MEPRSWRSSRRTATVRRCRGSRREAHGLHPWDAQAQEVPRDLPEVLEEWLARGGVRVGGGGPGPFDSRLPLLQGRCGLGCQGRLFEVVGGGLRLLRADRLRSQLPPGAVEEQFDDHQVSGHTLACHRRHEERGYDADSNPGPFGWHRGRQDCSVGGRGEWSTGVTSAWWRWSRACKSEVSTLTSLLKAGKVVPVVRTSVACSATSRSGHDARGGVAVVLGACIVHRRYGGRC